MAPAGGMVVAILQAVVTGSELAIRRSRGGQEQRVSSLAPLLWPMATASSLTAAAACR